MTAGGPLRRVRVNPSGVRAGVYLTGVEEAPVALGSGYRRGDVRWYLDALGCRLLARALLDAAEASDPGRPPTLRRPRAPDAPRGP